MAILEATVKGKLFGQDCVNVIHFERTPFAQADMAELVQQLLTRFIGQAIFLQVTQFNWYLVEIRHIDPNPLPPVVWPTSVNGFVGVGPVFAPLCMVFKKKTNFGGPRNRGRIYLSGAGTNVMDQVGQWSNQQLLNMSSVAGSWKQWFVTNGGQSGFKMVLHPRDVIGNVGVDVIDIVPRSYPGTQVRRNLFRGA